MGNAVSAVLSKISESFHGRDDAEAASATVDTATVPATPEEPQSDIEKSVARLNAIMAEKVRLQGLRAEETSKSESLNEQIQAIDAKRIEALTTHKISGDNADRERAEEMLQQIGRLKQDMTDAAAVANGIAVKLAELDEERKAAERDHQSALGVLLDTQMERLVAEYDDLAPKLAQVIMNVDAIQNMMIKCGAGNSNGWWRDARLPTIKPRDGRTYAPILDTTNAEFGRASKSRAQALTDELKATGFMWRYYR